MTGIIIKLTVNSEYIEGTTENATFPLDIKFNFKATCSLSKVDDKNIESLGKYLKIYSFNNEKDEPLILPGDKNIINDATGVGFNCASTVNITSKDQTDLHLATIYPCFTYADGMKPNSIDDFTAIKNSINNTKFVFTFELLSVEKVSS